ncbi:MAG: VWA domain-containing protein [Candidatus Omnitrophota bacterium]|jgi:Ca-activated chloride channel family protein
MQFFRPEYFLYLWLVPAILAFYIFSHKLWQKRIHRLVQDEELLSKLIEGHRKNEWLIRAVLSTLAVLCFVLALARPQWGDEKRTAQRKGVDIIFMVDTSLSMLAEDIKPNRLEKAKFEIETFVRSLRGDRVGMVTFAGSGFLQTPLTLDHAAFLLFLDAVQVGFLPDAGTSLAQAVHLAIRAFPQKELKYKALILFTDGEDHEGGIERAIEEAKQANVRIYCIGLGTAEGEPIPLKNEKGERSGFKKDRNGQMVLTRLNQPLLERLARETGGIYLPATPGEKEVDVIMKHLRGWGEQQFAEKMIVEREDQYQVFLILALIFLIAEMLVRRKNGKNPALLACLAAFFLFTGFLETSQDTVKKGNDHFQNKRYQSALEAYRKVQVKNPDAPEVLYDLGTALYKVDSFQESAQDLETASKKTKDPQLKARALYNIGNVQYRLGNFEEAIDSYKKALALDPSDKDAKYNLEFLQKQKNKIDKKDQEKKKEDQKKDEQKKDQQKNKQEQQQNQGQEDQQNQKDQDQQNKDQKDQQNQDQQQQQKEQEQKEKEKQEKQQKQEDQQQQPKPQEQQNQDQQQQQKEQEQKEKEKQEEQKQSQQQSQKEQEDQQQKEQKEQQNQLEQQKKSTKDERQGQQKRPLQGQMSMDNALNLLDALKESEKELQDLRRPPVNKNPPPVEKDW